MWLFGMLKLNFDFLGKPLPNGNIELTISTRPVELSLDEFAEFIRKIHMEGLFVKPALLPESAETVLEGILDAERGS